MTDSKKITPSIKFNFTKKTEQEVSVFFGDNLVQDINLILQNQNYSNVIFLVDEKVLLYHNKLIKNLESVGSIISFLSTEENKSFLSLGKLIEEIVNQGGNSKTIIGLIGGGILGNIGGLASSLLYRGINFFHVPTTLIAQLDSGVDVKSSVNFMHLKNGIGIYKAPEFVYVYPEFISTLPQREVICGISEAIKHSIAQSEDLLSYIEVNIEKIINKDIEVLGKITKDTINLKIQHWKNTEDMWNSKEKKERLTHIGHTIGKILEMVDIDYLNHGEAIAHGTIIELIISNKLGYVDQEFIYRIIKLYDSLGSRKQLNIKYSTKSISHLLFKNNNEPIFAILLKEFSSQTLSTTVDRNLITETIDKYLLNI